jgi:hypothetical protein
MSATEISANRSSTKNMQILLRDFYTKLSVEHAYSKMLGLVVTSLHRCNKPSEICVRITLNRIKIFLRINLVLL